MGDAENAGRPEAIAGRAREVFSLRKVMPNHAKRRGTSPSAKKSLKAT